MKFMRSPIRLLWLPVIVLVCAANIAGQTTVTPSAPPRSEVKLEGASFQDVLNRLFGAPDTPGLLSLDKPFQLRAEDLVLTREQADNFFAPASPNSMDFATLVSAAEQQHGQLRLEGMSDGIPFELKLAGREIKLEGLSFTQAELDSLVDRLRAISGIREFKIEGQEDGRFAEFKFERGREQAEFKLEGLNLTQAEFDSLIERFREDADTREAKIEALVDGRPVEFKFERDARGAEIKLEGLTLTQEMFDALVERFRGVEGAREIKIEAFVDGRLVEAKFEHDRLEFEFEDGDHRRGGDHLRHDADHNRGRGSDDRRERVEIRERDDHERMERTERVEISNSGRGSERIERVEKIERPDREDRVERIEFERPENEHGGSGRR